MESSSVARRFVRLKFKCFLTQVPSFLSDRTPVFFNLASKSCRLEQRQFISTSAKPITENWVEKFYLSYNMNKGRVCLTGKVTASDAVQETWLWTESLSKFVCAKRFSCFLLDSWSGWLLLLVVFNESVVMCTRRQRPPEGISRPWESFEKYIKERKHAVSVEVKLLLLARNRTNCALRNVERRR